MALKNFHENLSHNETIKLGSNRKFGFVIGGIFILIGVWLLHKDHDIAGTLAAILGFYLVVGGWLFPARLTVLHRLWIKLGELLHHVINPLVMLLLYVSTIIPTGLTMRLFGKDPLRRTLDTAAKTYWLDHHGDVTAESMKRQF